MSLKEHLYAVPRYGDSLFLLASLNWKGWPHLGKWIAEKGNDGSMFMWFLSSTMLMYGTELFANSLRVFFRVNPGRNASGLITTLFTTFLIMAFNHEELPKIFVVLTTIFGPFVIIITKLGGASWQEIIDSIWYPESIALMVFMITFLVIGLIKIYGLYFLKWKNEFNDFKKGDSIFYKLLSKRVRYLGEDFYTILYEPALAIGLGWLIINYANDSIFGTYLIVSGICLFIQEAIDGLVKYT